MTSVSSRKGRADLEGEPVTKRLNNATNEPSGLLRLPVELRLQVYGYILPDAISAFAPSGHSQGPENQNSLAITRVNRLINEEATEELYKNCEMQIDIDSGDAHYLQRNKLKRTSQDARLAFYLKRF